MRVLGLERLSEHSKSHPEASASLGRWKKVMETTSFGSVPDLRRTFGRSYDYVRPGCHVFDIANNRHRLVARVDFETQTALVESLMTHKQYDGWRCR